MPGFLKCGCRRSREEQQRVAARDQGVLVAPFPLSVAEQQRREQQFAEVESRTERLELEEDVLLQKLCRAPTLEQRLLLYTALIRVRAALAIEL